MTLLLAMTAASLTLPPPHWSTNSAFYGFEVYQGPKSGTYTNKVDAGWPRTGPTNFTFTMTGLGTNTNYFAVVAYWKTNGLESPFSNELATNKITNATLAWTWQIPPPLPVTNVITISSGTNRIALTNSRSASQTFRLRGASYTNMALEFALDARPPWAPLTNWFFAGFQVPILSITKTNL